MMWICKYRCSFSFIQAFIGFARSWWKICFERIHSKGLLAKRCWAEPKSTMSAFTSTVCQRQYSQSFEPHSAACESVEANFSCTPHSPSWSVTDSGYSNRSRWQVCSGYNRFARLQVFFRIQVGGPSDPRNPPPLLSPRRFTVWISRSQRSRTWALMNTMQYNYRFNKWRTARRRHDRQLKRISHCDNTQWPTVRKHVALRA